MVEIGVVLHAGNSAKRPPKRRQGPLQPELFEPKDFEHDHKVVITNKRINAKKC